MPKSGVVLGAVALAVCATTCAGSGTATPFRAGASEGGYTVLYDLSGLPPHNADGPCVQMVPNAAVRQAETGIGQINCTGTQFGLNVQATPLDRDLIAVWGIVPATAATVTVAHRAATLKDHTYLAVIPKPPVSYLVVAWDRSRRQLASLSSDQLPPPVPNVSS